MSASIGHFHAVGVGPGDPELLTLRAVKRLQQAAVIVHAGPDRDRGRALDVVRHLLRPDQEVRTLRTASMAELSAEPAQYWPAIERIAADCRQGRDVVLITEGDPALYSTAAVVWQLLAELAPDVPLEVVPGISSITAAAARLCRPLAQKDEWLAVVPAGHVGDQLSFLLDRFANLCLLKAGPALPQLATLLNSSSQHEAVYLENLGTPREWLATDLADAVPRNEYFSLVLVRRKKDRPSGSVPAQRPAKVWVLGLGPGDPALLTGRAREVLRSVDALVGYEGYLQSLDSLNLAAERHGFPLGAEVERASRAMELARAGRSVALVSSGDSGVYGMASVLVEAVGTRDDIEIEVVPGVTAAVSAAALLGAPLGHDFACLSLSDLLTPWPTIERRLHAAGEADFVLVLYNPASRQRTWQLPRARDVLLRYRRPETPVGLVDRAYRPGQRVWHTTLGELSAEGVGMETTVIIGSSQTRVVHGRMLTPRGQATSPNPVKTGGLSPSLARRPPPARKILEESFAIIERELAPHALPPWAFAVVRRMIHASADFDFARTLRYSTDFDAAARNALRRGVPIVTDTEMVLVGLHAMVAGREHLSLACHLNDPRTAPLVETEGLTRSAAGIRVAARSHPAPLLVVGNAPTALDEALRLVEQEGWRPVAIVGMPVGLVGVVEAKTRLLGQRQVPYLSCIGRKGGSAVAAAAVNALIELTLDE
jgi:precorrin-2 C(20)-methyltransferase